MLDNIDGRTQIGIGVAIAVLVLGGVAYLTWGGGDSPQDAHSEVEELVAAIRKAELDYHSAFGEFLAAEAAPRAPHEVDGSPVAWAPTKGFRSLSWAPPQPEAVLGSYSVMLTPNGFKVIGVCDGDADGTIARWEATETESAKQVSAEGTY